MRRRNRWTCDQCSRRCENRRPYRVGGKKLCSAECLKLASVELKPKRKYTPEKRPMLLSALALEEFVDSTKIATEKFKKLGASLSSSKPKPKPKPKKVEFAERKRAITFDD